MNDPVISEIKDLFGKGLKICEEKPTEQQALYAWFLLNELLQIDYPQNWINERNDIVSYISDMESLRSKAMKIRRAH